MKFSFNADFQGLLTTFTAERIYSSKQHERYRLMLAGSGQSIIIQTNRPAAENNKLGKPAQWYVIEGAVTDKAAMQPVYKALETTINNIPRTVQGTFNFIEKM